MTENEKVVANERFRDAVVAYFEAQEASWNASMGLPGHPWKCMCDGCKPLTLEYDRLSVVASKLRHAAREARKALS